MTKDEKNKQKADKLYPGQGGRAESILVQKGIPTVKIKLKESVIKRDDFGNELDVSHKGYMMFPDNVYTVPNTAFWTDEARRENGRYTFADTDSKKKSDDEKNEWDKQKAKEEKELQDEREALKKEREALDKEKAKLLK